MERVGAGGQADLVGLVGRGPGDGRDVVALDGLARDLELGAGDLGGAVGGGHLVDGDRVLRERVGHGDLGGARLVDGAVGVHRERDVGREVVGEAVGLGLGLVERVGAGGQADLVGLPGLGGPGAVRGLAVGAGDLELGAGDLGGAVGGGHLVDGDLVRGERVGDGGAVGAHGRRVVGVGRGLDDRVGESLALGVVVVKLRPGVAPLRVRVHRDGVADVGGRGGTGGRRLKLERDALGPEPEEVVRVGPDLRRGERGLARGDGVREVGAGVGGGVAGDGVLDHGVGHFAAVDVGGQVAPRLGPGGGARVAFHDRGVAHGLGDLGASRVGVAALERERDAGRARVLRVAVVDPGLRGRDGRGLGRVLHGDRGAVDGAVGRARNLAGGVDGERDRLGRLVAVRRGRLGELVGAGGQADLVGLPGLGGPGAVRGLAVGAGDLERRARDLARGRGVDLVDGDLVRGGGVINFYGIGVIFDVECDGFSAVSDGNPRVVIVRSRIRTREHDIERISRTITVRDCRL